MEKVRKAPKLPSLAHPWIQMLIFYVLISQLFGSLQNVVALNGTKHGLGTKIFTFYRIN